LSRPSVAIIIPCYNESRTIVALFDAIRGQSFPLSDMEIIVADGKSTDGTRQLADSYALAHPELNMRLVDNPERSIPAALNRAIGLSKAGLILRLDAHSVPSNDFVERCLQASEQTGAANVGGVWEIRPSGSSLLARAIAVAASHPLGAGDARYRIGGAAGEVDTVPFGAFRREWIERVGPFNEALRTNEDYEYNVRLRRAGGRIWFDPSIRSVYLARPDLGALARQYARYGYWKARMALGFPESLRWRQVLPPLFVLSLASMALLAFFVPAARWVVGLAGGIYALSVIAAGLIEAVRRRDLGLALGFPVAVAIMHLCWGTAFLAGVFAGRAGKAVG
jgi:succinoglycan biosynthesis protein ExoA